MITSKDDYIYYLEADRLGMKKKKQKPSPFIDIEWKYTRLLRKVEYINNCKAGLLWNMCLKLHKLRLYKLSVKTGITIPPNTFGPGLTLFHHGTIIVNESARIGNDCQLYCSTNIADGVRVGNKVFIAPGAKVLNNVVIADGVRIGANAVVNKSITEPNITVAGAPAVKVSGRGTSEHYKGGTELIAEMKKIRESG